MMLVQTLLIAVIVTMVCVALLRLGVKISLIDFDRKKAEKILSGEATALL